MYIYIYISTESKVLHQALVFYAAWLSVVSKSYQKFKRSNFLLKVKILALAHECLPSCPSTVIALRWRPQRYKQWVGGVERGLGDSRRRQDPF